MKRKLPDGDDELVMVLSTMHDLPIMWVFLPNRLVVFEMIESTDNSV